MKRVPARVKQPMILPIGPDIVWSLDFMADIIESGRTFGLLTAIDGFNRKALAMVTDVSLSSKRVTREIDRVIEWRGKPEAIGVDNGPEFTAAWFVEWCEDKEIDLRNIQPDKTTQNSSIERFNRSYRTEVLKAYSLESLSQVRSMSADWQWRYNAERPHNGFENRMPLEFLSKNGKLSEFPTFQQDTY